MSMDFLERLRNNCLTSVEDYRRMQVKLHEMRKESEPVDQSGKSEEWKNWELAPLDAPVKHASVKQGADPIGEASHEASTEAVKGVHKALRAIDKF